MRTILYILQKEFRQVFRNKTMLPIIFVVPVVQLLILVHAATFELKHIELFVVDQDMSATSRKLTSKFEGSPFFFTKQASFSVNQAENALLEDEADVIPQGFENELVRENQTEVQFLVNAINGMAAGLSNAYATSILAGFNKDIVLEWANLPKGIIAPSISINPLYWYNPEFTCCLAYW